MEYVNCDMSPVKEQLKADLQQLVTRMETCLADLDDENYCLLQKFEDIRETFVHSEAIASSFYLQCYLSPYTDKYMDLTMTLRNLAERRFGALIVVERKIPLEPLIHSGTQIDAALTYFLLESIFNPGSPLHDGAVLIRADKIISAANVLPLSASLPGMEKIGTRHRAALGLSEKSDALVLVLSEETGRASFAIDGKLYPISHFRQH
ncbi:sporulation-specific diadenylate cyclase CdaS [Paenibacillus abyssi]|uniref:Diadenylate cyclase n=1 Tax=Paenibacillus abyssi TaxID=1340531 RepID=A0A917LI74_9BACL|nr:sporulation-specific diadenylate cyclase CdaS [Paenibacillus abyssi]GGG26111.1 hypothetical protein GCM10010916_48130 [Paenibacillus abyssi]